MSLKANRLKAEFYNEMAAKAFQARELLKEEKYKAESPVGAPYVTILPCNVKKNQCISNENTYRTHGGFGRYELRSIEFTRSNSVCKSSRLSTIPIRGDRTFLGQFPHTSHNIPSDRIGLGHFVRRFPLDRKVGKFRFFRRKKVEFCGYRQPKKDHYYTPYIIK